MKSPLPYRKNFTLKIGDDFSEVITFTGQTITSWTFEGQAVGANNSDTTSLTFTKASPSVTVSIPAATTANYGAQPFNYSIKITRGGVKKTYFEGVINVTE